MEESLVGKGRPHLTEEQDGGLVLFHRLLDHIKWQRLSSRHLQIHHLGCSTRLEEVGLQIEFVM